MNPTFVELMDLRASSLELASDLAYICTRRKIYPDDRPDNTVDERWQKLAWVYDLAEENLLKISTEMINISKNSLKARPADPSIESTLDWVRQYYENMKARVASWEASVTIGKLDQLGLNGLFKKDDA